jgi:hypothetical protein
VEVFYQPGNELSGSIKYLEALDLLSEWLLVNKDTDPFS